MASVYDSNDADFDLHWLRSLDASYLQGATRASGSPPMPIVLATGPWGVGAPSAAVSAGAHSVVGYTVPALAGVAWVMVQAGVFVRANAVATRPTALCVCPIGNPADAGDYRGPLIASSDMALLNISNAGFIYGAAPNGWHGESLWVPLDPEDTVDGFQMVVDITAPAGGLAANDLRVEARACVYVGYPINAWNTGFLASQFASRGS